MQISDIIYVTFLMILLFIIVYKGFSFTTRPNEQHNNFNAVRDEIYYNRYCLPGTDRQGNNCTQDNETSRDNRYNDIFFIEPNSQEAARIRAQLEKDDKDLPSYDEVMRVANVPTPTAALAAGNLIPAMPSALTMGASGSIVNTTDAILPVPPYRVAESNVRPLTPPPYTPEPIGASVVLPITSPLHSQQNPQAT